MKCLHCKIGIQETFAATRVAQYAQLNLNDGKLIPGEVWTAFHQRCPECHKVMIDFTSVRDGGVSQRHTGYPHSSAGERDIPPEVTSPFRDDLKEACTVLPLSAKASAALSRRCLQSVLKEKGGAKKKDLIDQIEEVIANGGIPTSTAEQLHAVRHIGNFAAHPTKSTITGEILDVEVGEAEWNLDVLEALFDLYFVQPAIAAKRKEELNKKLKEAGKPEIK
jgi:hypothetical protein